MRPASALIAVAALVTGVAVGWFARPSVDSVATDPARADRAETRIRELEAQVARLEGDVREAEDRRVPRLATAGRPAGAPTPVVEASAEAPQPTPAAERDAKSPHLAPKGYEELVTGVDWSVVGKNLHEMTPLMAQVGEEWSRTGTLPMALYGRMQEMNGPLVTAALHAAGKLKLPIQKANTAFTHPVFSANALASMLADAGKPLTDAQLEELSRLAERFAAEDAARLAGYDARAWELQKAIDESTLRDRFFEAAFALLTDEQRALLAPESARGRLKSDFFSSGLVWAARSQLLQFASPEALTATMEAQFLRHFELGADRAAAVHDVVARWVAGLPPAWTSEPGDPLTLVGMMPVARVLEAARLQLAMLDDLIRTLALDEAAAKRIRGTDFVFVPVRSAPK
ncbi:MAG TPA: hypothetical protein VND21_00425 [Planctomycetota bacterium]|jgi:hypothetical protein|nr:hypothetical protein [Planctomycetota bacterium]